MNKLDLVVSKAEQQINSSRLGTERSPTAKSVQHSSTGNKLAASVQHRPRTAATQFEAEHCKAANGLIGAAQYDRE